MIRILLFVLVMFACEARASTVTYTRRLDFGKLLPTSGSGNLTMSTAGTVSSSSGVQIFQNGYQGLFNYAATGLGSLLNVNLDISVTTSTLTLTSSYAGAPSITVNNFVVSPSSYLITLASPNINNINLGGTVSFSSTPRGTYTGSVGVLVTSTLGLIPATSGTVPVQVIFMNVLSISETVQMNFGSINVAGGGSGVIRLTSQGVRSVVSGSGVSLAVTGSVPAAGKFAITGEPNQSVQISIPSTISLSGSNGGSLTISNVAVSPESPYVLDTNGSLNLLTAGNVTVSAGQKSGTYTGTYTVNVNY